MAPDSPTPRETILVVDDDLHSRLVVEGHLTAEGYTVIQAENGLQATAMFAADSPDLVLLDVQMPVVDGFDVCRRIRAMQTGKEVPILFLTALGDSRTQQKALDSDADDFLCKPVQPVELLLRVKSLLRLKRLETELAHSHARISSQRDALLRAEEGKRRLTAMIVHDLRSPLSCVLANADYLLDAVGPNERLKEVLRDIHAVAERMHRMSLDLLDVFRSEEGALLPRLEPLDVTGLLGGVGPYLRWRARESRHQIIAENQTSIESILADKDLIRRVIENLVDNSTKYAPDGTDIRLEVSALDGDRILFIVRDDGPGVPPEFRTKIFDPYARLQTNGPEGARGSCGLGLAFCRLAVEAHGGEIWVEDNLPAGSAFCFWIPRAVEGQGVLATAGASLEAA
jgi:signal transduction histidine kinase